MGPDLAHLGKIAKTVKARDLWDKIGLRGWRAPIRPAFHTTINDWHTCPASGKSAPPIRARNMFLDDTACNLASLNC